MSQETIQESFVVGEPAQLKVSNLRGSVTVRGGQAGQVQVTAVVHTGSGDAEHTRVEIRQNEDGSVTAETRYDESRWGLFGLSRPCKVDYSIGVPQNCRLRASGVSSSLDIAGFSGELVVSAVSGPVELDDLNGDLKINSVSGPVRGTGLAGSLQIETVSGDVDLSNCALSSVAGKTVSGRLNLHSSSDQGAYRLRSVSGDCRLDLPEISACRVRMSAISGRFNSSAPFSQAGRNHGDRLYVLGESGPEVSFNSISGSLYLTLSPDLASAPAQPGTAPQGKEVLDRMEVLERIERGEFSVEDGLVALSGKKA